MDCSKCLAQLHFVYQLLMTLLVMMLQLVLVMRPQLAMMLAATGDSCRAMGA